MTHHATAHPRSCTGPHRLVRAYCVCWGLVTLVDWEIGTTCSRCGDTFITEAEYLKRRAALRPKPAKRLKPMHQRPTTTVATEEVL